MKNSRTSSVPTLAMEGRDSMSVVKMSRSCGTVFTSRKMRNTRMTRNNVTSKASVSPANSRMNTVVTLVMTRRPSKQFHHDDQYCCTPNPTCLTTISTRKMKPKM